jgi:hypothetical protein
VEVQVIWIVELLQVYTIPPTIAVQSEQSPLSRYQPLTHEVAYGVSSHVAQLISIPEQVTQSSLTK